MPTLLAIALLSIPTQAALPVGPSRVELDFDGLKLEVFTHKPAGWQGERLLLVFHGVNRNADEYRDHAVVLAERYSMLVVAPRFDAERFPSRKYQRGGILEEDGTAAKPEDWTYAYVPRIARAIREREQKEQLPYWLIGHSAGGQFCLRMAAFQATGAERIVAANAGTVLFPARDADFGYGFGGLPAALSSDEILKGYLAAPLTLYLGTADDRVDEWLDTSPAAMQQGPGRLQRNRAAFEAARTLAAAKGWTFAWTKVEAEGVPHDHARMFAHPSVAEALFGRPEAAPAERAR
jgi:pimeloyl-ACP methyl ester carboxylesterase